MHRTVGDLARPPAKSTLANAVGNVIDPLNKNPNSVNAALQVLETFTEIGKVIPFVAPAFVMFRIILDLERQAQDVDAKCNDLLERITFMLSHLPALQKIKIMPVTRQVIERINEALKDAASLISAYRKQGRVVRRLKITNCDNFRTCAENISNCSRDLLMSLQIQQTVRLDILTRDVPIDDEDRAAQTFIEAHGGTVDAVMHDRELVKEFCQQQHFVMDDSVMEQLNTSIADSVQQNHARLENILRDNVSSAIADGLKNLSKEMNALEAEQKFHCVQCDKEFTNFTNGSKACSFHRAEYDSWSKQFPCCSTVHPCEFGTHRSKHHCDYPYGAFFNRAQNVAHYRGTRDNWAVVEDRNFETDETQKASVGQLLRWKSYGDRVDADILFIIVGRVWYNYPYYFNTFTAKDLEDINKSVRLSRRTLIFRTAPNESEYAMAEWILSTSGDITGIRVTAKTATSANPRVRVCPIDLATCKKSGDVLTTSQGRICSYIPATPYILPETLTISPTINDKQSRPVRTDFKTKSSPSLRVILKATSDPPLEANPDNINTECDYFHGRISVFNNNLPKSLDFVTISSISAFYRMVGDPEYLPAQSCKLLDGLDSKMPMTIEPRQSCQLNFQVSVPRPEEDSKRNIIWRYRASLARYRPVRIKLVLEDIEGEQCSLVLEYVHRPFPLTQRGETDLGFFFFDDPTTFERNSVQVKPIDIEGSVLSIEGNGIAVESLEKMVYQALKSGKTEVDLRIGANVNDGQWEWKVWALIDLSCQRVYAFKIIVQEGEKVQVRRSGCIGYVPCPQYGEVSDQTRPISYATETATLPPLEPYPVQAYPQDDTLDDSDSVAPKSKYPAAEVYSGSATPDGKSTIPPYMTNMLASIDTNLSSTNANLVSVKETLDSINTNLARVAAAFEKLVSVMPNVSGNVETDKRS